RLEPRERIALVAGPGFDGSVWEIWPALAAGACLVAPDEETRAAPAALAAWLARERIAVAFLPTPLAEATLTALDGGGARWPPEAPLRLLLTGGDRLHRGAPAGLPFALVNHYGPTEASVVATAGPVAPEAASPPIGRPIANASAFLADRRLAPAPLGTAAELYLGGAGLARGYLGRPDLTAERFLPNPFAGPGEGGARLYRSGDRARWLPDGDLEFLGRADLQVQIRGVRIEPGEVEAAVRAGPGVAAAAVVAREDPARGTYLAAYVTPAAPGGDLASYLLRFLRARLPEAMVPAAVVVLAALPMTPNGKVDRRALAALPGPERAWVAPRTRDESRVAALFAEVLGVSGVGATDDFFALGGHSLRATQLSARLADAFGVEVPLGRIFEARTVEALAREVAAGRSPASAGIPRADPGGEGAPVPASFAEERLWFLEQLHPGPLYNVPGAALLRGALDAPALALAAGEVVRRHDTLRSAYAPPRAPGEPPARTPAAWPRGTPLPLPAIDLAGLAAGRRERESARLAREEAARPF